MIRICVRAESLTKRISYAGLFQGLYGFFHHFFRFQFITIWLMHILINTKQKEYHFLWLFINWLLLQFTNRVRTNKKMLLSNQIN